MVFAITGAAAAGGGTSTNVTITDLPANLGAQLVGVTAAGTYQVRATLPTALTASLVVNDPYAPFGTAVTYRCVAYPTGGGVVQVDAAAPFTLNYASALVTDTGTGTSVVVTVQQQDSRRYDARSVFYDVIGRTAPVVASQPARLMGGRVRFRCADLASREALSAFLRAGYPLVLRTPWKAGVDDVTFLPLDWEDEATDPAAGPYYLNVSYQAVDMGAVPLNAPPLTYAGMAVALSTYAGLTTIFPTYLKMAGA